MSDTPAGPRGPEGAGGPQEQTDAPPGHTAPPQGQTNAPPVWPPTPASAPAPAYPRSSDPSSYPPPPSGPPPYAGAPAGWSPPPWPPPPGTRSGPPWKIIIPVVGLVVLLGIAFVVAVSVFAYKELSGQVKGANAYLRTLKANDLEAGYTHVCDSAKATLTEAAYVRRSSERMAALGPISSYFVSPSTLHVRDHPEYNAVEVKVVASSGIHHYLGELVHEDGTWHWCGTARRVGQTEAPLPLP